MAKQGLFLSRAVYLIVFLAMAAVYGIFDRSNLGPYSNHQWRQSDCLSITQHYADGVSFLEPEIYWLGEKDEGKTISEFPVVYYMMGKLWSIFGRQYWMYRFFCFLIFAVGLYFLRKLCVGVLNNHFWGSYIALLMFTSPVLIFYSDNFLMNVNALSLAMIATYQYWQYLQIKTFRRLFLACLFFTLAGLLKLTALLVFFCVGGIFLYRRILKNDWKERKKEFLPFAGVMVVILTWHSYVNDYNSQHLSQIFLQGILPIWELSPVDVWSNFRLLVRELLPEVFPIPVLIALFALWMFLLFNAKKAHSFWFALTILSSGATMLYLLLFYQALNQHEYYLINVSFVIPILLLTFFLYLNQQYPQLLNRNWFRGVGIAAFMVLTYNAAVQTRIKFSVQESWVSESPLLSQKKRNYWSWFHWNYDEHFRALETIEPVLESLGIEKNDRVLSIPDISINVSLYLMNRHGYTNFWVMTDPVNQELMGVERLLKTIDWGAKYVVVNDTSILSQPGMRQLVDQELGHHKNVYVFSARKR